MSWMIDDKDPACLDIANRAEGLGITGMPDKASHALGPITLANGQTVQAHVVHAIDPIITDGKGIVTIIRLNEPGKGKPALPGGLIDPLKSGGIESAVQAGAREAMEEAGVDLSRAKATLIGTRNMNRPHDVRIAMNGGLEEKYGIKEGDAFMVSLQSVRYDVPTLSHMTLTAGDDAAPGSARYIPLKGLKADHFGVAEQFHMVEKAIPEAFPAHPKKLDTSFLHTSKSKTSSDPKPF
jgi:ADP-ribose pyrophosphatase YjhB (NUDIX family)